MLQPSYVKLYENNELTKRIEIAYERLRECQICPRRCKVNRLAGQRGVCKVGELPMVSSCNPHFGEEGPLVGTHGSGTIFITYCNLGCIFCQNYDISHKGIGEEISLERFAQMMLELQGMGCHNINFVSPTHVVPQILSALPIAIEGGLHIPLVYNTGGYDLVETLKLLDGVFDIYMPDFKFTDAEVAKRVAKAGDYPQRAKEAVKEMHRQAGDLVLNKEGVAERGLLVRHLVLPEGLAGTKEIVRFLAQEVSRDSYINIMDQYRPCGSAYMFPPLGRFITSEEFYEALRIAMEEGLHRFDKIERKVRIIRWL